MRTAFINQLIEEARKNDKIFLVVGDLGYSVVEPFAQEFPNRFLNAGIAEQNMLGLAAGLSMEGYNVFVYSIGNFPTLRCMEQIRYDVCYHNLNVKIIAVGGGFAYGPLGPSHHATEELGMLRILPNLAVTSPGDPLETRRITTLLSSHNGPAYLRIGKAGEKKVHESEISLNWGEIIEVINGDETAIFATGSILNYCKNYINTNNLKWGLYSIPFIKPIDLKQLAQVYLKYKKFISFEEHQKIGGIGSLLLESANYLKNKNFITRFPDIEIRAIEDMFFSKAGSQEYIREQTGITFKA
jgi:transketolase